MRPVPLPVPLRASVCMGVCGGGGGVRGVFVLAVLMVVCVVGFLRDVS